MSPLIAQSAGITKRTSVVAKSSLQATEIAMGAKKASCPDCLKANVETPAIVVIEVNKMGRRRAFPNQRIDFHRLAPCANWLCFRNLQKNA